MPSQADDSAVHKDLQTFPEQAVDTALVALLDSSESFRTWFLERVLANDETPLPNVTYRGARRSVHYANGESDVAVEWSSAGGAVVVLVENKLKVAFQPNQGGRYAERAQEIAQTRVATVRTVLLAPQQYLRAANPEAHKFDIRLPLEEVIEAASICGCHEEADILAGAVERVAEGGALGSKGLYPTVYAAIAAECERRDNGLRITNKATDWVFLTHPSRPVGMELRYRIGERIAEIAFTNVFKGDREALLARVTPPLVTAKSGSYCFVRTPTLNTTEDKEAFSEADAAIVVDALQQLIEWWRGVSNM
ncbi:MAG TPA: hypothetical protein VIL13_05070 [Longimicrobiales bacterium]